MESNEEPILSAINKQAIVSVVFAVLTILSFCTGWLPIPFTGFICFPISFLSAVLALIFGIISLIQIRRLNESGHHYAWSGIVIGGFVFVCILCMLAALISFFIFAPGSIPTPPFIQKYL
jgi:hypothetical protein